MYVSTKYFDLKNQNSAKQRSIKFMLLHDKQIKRALQYICYLPIWPRPSQNILKITLKNILKITPTVCRTTAYL